MQFNTKISNLPFSFFEKVNRNIIKHKREDFISFHQGLTYFPPCADMSGFNSDHAHHDAPPSGDEALLAAIAAKMTRQYKFEIQPGNIAITYGISHGLNCAFKLVLSPGDEVMILSPHWLFVRGHIIASGGQPVEVPFFTELNNENGVTITTILQRHLSANTRAIYFNTPNNPTGISLNHEQLKEILRFAEKNDLWIVADNAYEFYDFSTGGFHDIMELDNARERVFSCYSFSKSYSMAGYRIGYTIPPSQLSLEFRKMILYSVYCIANPSQYAAIRALQTPAAVIEERTRIVERLMQVAVSGLKIPFIKPQGGFYLFLQLGGLPVPADDFVAACIRNGASLTPGIFFGERYANYARLCFTTVPEHSLLKGIEIINNTYYQTLNTDYHGLEKQPSNSQALGI